MAIAFFVIALISIRMTETDLLSEKITTMSMKTGELSNEVSQDLALGNSHSLYNKIIEHGQELSCRIIVVNEAAVVQMDSFSALNGSVVESRELLEVLTGTKADSYGYHQITDETETPFWAVYFASAIIRDSKIIGAVLVSQSIQDIVSKTQATAQGYLMIFVAAMLIIVILSYYLTNHISRPIDDLRNASIKIAHGDYKARVLPLGNNELTELAKAFNTMSRRLQNVDKQRNQFVSNASHELKTPLASMKILVESLLYQDSQIDPGVLKDFLGDIDKELDRLTNLINDLLYITKMDDETDVIEVENVDLGDLISQIVMMLIPIAEKKNISLDLIENKKVHAECNAVMVRQAISNLTDNAIKYTKEGGKITVTISEDEENAFVAIRDTGVGIDRDDLQHIFERFYRVDKARSRLSGGTGLGLNIAHSIAVIHGGKINVKSRLGQGSEFTFIIPKIYSKGKTV